MPERTIDVTDHRRQADELRRQADELELEAVRSLRGQGLTWQQVAVALGMNSAQAAHGRFASRIQR